MVRAPGWAASCAESVGAARNNGKQESVSGDIGKHAGPLRVAQDDSSYFSLFLFRVVEIDGVAEEDQFAFRSDDIGAEPVFFAVG